MRNTTDNDNIFGVVLESHGTTEEEAGSAMTIIRIPLYALTFLVHLAGFCLLYTVKIRRPYRRPTILTDTNNRMLMFLSLRRIVWINHNNRWTNKTTFPCRFNFSLPRLGESKYQPCNYLHHHIESSHKRPLPVQIYG